MERWKTTTKRYTPKYKTHPRSWREGQLGVQVVYCPECDHDVNRHFYEAEHPELCFCQIQDCDCTCSQWR